MRDELDERAVGDFILLGGYEDRDITIYADIKRIPPGHFLVVADDGARLTRYFDWPDPVDARAPSPDDCLEQFRVLLARAVRDRLRTPKVAVFMSGGVDSSLVALTAKRQLERQFATPEIQAYCTVYDRLIPDDERRHAALVANSLSIPIDFQAMDDGALFDWVGRLSPAEPLADIVIGPFLDQLARLASRFAVVLTGWDGDTLLMAAIRLHWKERLARGEFGALARELLWYVTTQRALPPIGVRTALASRERAVAQRRRPSWLSEAFWQRAGLERRWSAAAGPAAPTRSREPSVRAFAGRAWGPLFDGHDPRLPRPSDRLSPSSPRPAPHPVRDGATGDPMVCEQTPLATLSRRASRCDPTSAEDPAGPRSGRGADPASRHRRRTCAPIGGETGAARRPARGTGGARPNLGRRAR